MVDEDEGIVLVRATNSVDKELEHKILFWYLNRIELGYGILGGCVITGIVLGIPLFLAGWQISAALVSTILGPLAGGQIMSKWKYNRRSSYIWDTMHAYYLTGNGVRFLKKIAKETVLVPYPKPIESVFAGTKSNGGIGRIQPFQKSLGPVNWSDYTDSGEARRSMRGFDSAIGTIVIMDWEEGEGPAPGYWQGMDPPPGKTVRDMVIPTIGYRLRKTVISTRELR